MESIVKRALAKTLGGEQENPATRFKIAPTSGATFSDVDYYKLVEEEFGIAAKRANIAVIGCGGMGNNAVNRLSEMGVVGAKTIAINTDAKHLAIVKADQKILIGKELTRGLGAGGDPVIGRKAAEESRNEIKEALQGVDLLFAVAGLGKGTGSGSIPVVAEIAKQMGAIVIAVVTMPFKVEGARVVKAEDALAALRPVADTTIVIENDKLLKYAGSLSLQQAFAVADELIASMVKGITETITLPSLVNLDYADVKAVMKTGGVAAIGVGESTSSDRARDAVMKALTNPLLEVDYTGATGALVHITGGPDMTLEEVNSIGETVVNYLDPSAQVFWGARILPEFEGKIQVITIITGVKSPYILGPVARETKTVKELSPALGIEIIK